MFTSDNDNPLPARHLWITRPQSDAEQMAEQVSALGITPWVLPLLEIIPYLADNSAQSQLDQANSVIVTSRYAIAGALAQELSLPKQAQWFAIGQATAMALSFLNTPVICPEQQDSEGLLLLSELSAVQGQQMVILKGVGGRPTLSQQLQQRGAMVTELALYQRQCTAPSSDQIDAYLHANGKHLIALASGETLTCLLKTLTPSQKTRLLAHTHLAVMSKRIAQQAEQAGWHSNSIHIAPTASAEGLRLAIARA